MRKRFHSPTGLVGEFQADAADSSRCSKAAGTVRRIELAGAVAVPDLHLRAAAQINAAVALRRNLPIHQHLKIAVILRGAKVVALAVKHDLAVPTFQCSRMRWSALTCSAASSCGGHLGARGRIGHQAFPAAQILAVEQRHETLRRRVVRSSNRQFLDARCCGIQTGSRGRENRGAPGRAEIPDASRITSGSCTSFKSASTITRPFSTIL